jgi:hypothetical protein
MAGVLVAVAAEAQLAAPPRLPATAKPALVYVENAHGSEVNHLKVAWQEGDAIKTQEIAAGAYVAAAGLQGLAVLVSVGASAAESELRFYNLEAGSALPLSGRRGHSPIQFEREGERFVVQPSTQTAFLLQDAAGASDLEFITLEYTRANVRRSLLAKSLFKENFDDTVRLLIGPDGKHIAFLEAAPPPPDSERVLRYRLRVYHFSGNNVTTADEEVLVQYARDAESPFVWPPFMWDDNSHLLYFSVKPSPPGGPSQARYLLMSVEVEKSGKQVLMEQTLPLTRGNNRLYRDQRVVPQQVIFLHRAAEPQEYVVVGEALSLMPRPPVPPVVALKRAAGANQVIRDGLPIFTGEHFGERVSGVAAKYGKHVAFVMGTPESAADAARRCDLFVSFDGAEARKIGETGYHFEPLFWIE